MEVPASTIKSPVDLVEGIKVMASNPSEADQEQPIGRLRAMSKRNSLKLTRKKVMEVPASTIKSPVDFDDLVEGIKKMDSDASKTDQLELIDRLTALSERNIQKLTRMKVPGVHDGKLTVLEHLCVMKPSSKEVFCEVLKILLRNAVFDNEKEKDDDSADVPPLLHLAAYCGNYEAVTVLCNIKATNIFAKDRKSGFNVLHAAVISGDTRIARDIIVKACRETVQKFGDDLLNGIDKRKMTPLHYAAWEGDESMTNILLNWNRIVEVGVRSNAGVVVNARVRADHGLTAVHLAAMNHHIAVLRLLLHFQSPPRRGIQYFLYKLIGKWESMRERMLEEFDEAELHILQFCSARQSALLKKKLQRPSMVAAVPLWNELMKSVKADGKAEVQEQKQTGVEADEELETDKELEADEEREADKELDTVKELEAHADPLMFFVDAIRMLQSRACDEFFEEVLCGLLLLLDWSDVSQISRRKFPGANDGKLTVSLHLCVTKPCLEDVFKILLRGRKEHNSDKLEGTSIRLLHLSAYCSNSAAVNVLCGNWGASLVTLGSTGLTALHMAVKGGDIEVAESIIKSFQTQTLPLEPLVNAKDCLGMTALHYAVWEGNQRMLEFLLRRVKDVIDVTVSENNGLTVLHLAALNNDSVSLGILLGDTRVDVNACDMKGYTSLHLASWNNHAAVFGKLLDNPKIKVNVGANTGLTALHIAAWKNHVTILRKLLDHPQINVNAMDTYGLTAFNLPKGESQHEIEGPNSMEKSGRESFQMIFEELESHLLQFAVDRKSTLEKIKEERRQMSLEIQGPQGPELSRGDTNRRRAASILFDGLEDLPGNVKFTTLHRAVWRGSSELVTILVDMLSKAARSRATLNALDDNGMTALHFAVMRGDADMVEDLLSNKMVRGNIPEERKNRTPLNMAYILGKGDNLSELTAEARLEIMREYKVIIGFLLEHPDVKAYIEGLYRDRQLFVDAANAILVGAALIASITFAGWLQPPLGYQPLYDSKYLLTGAAPPDTYATYAAVRHHVSVTSFWNFNSLSFYFAVATVLLGACVVLPMLGKDELEADVRRMRNLHVWTTLSLSLSVFFVLGAFISAGFASLPPELEYQWGMIMTSAVGGSLSIIALSYYLYRVLTLMNKIRRTNPKTGSRQSGVGWRISRRSARS